MSAAKPAAENCLVMQLQITRAERNENQMERARQPSERGAGGRGAGTERIGLQR